MSIRFSVACAAAMLRVTPPSLRTEYTAGLAPSEPGIEAKPDLTITAIDGEPVCVTDKEFPRAIFTPPRGMSEPLLILPAVSKAKWSRICSAVCVAPAFCRKPGGLITVIRHLQALRNATVKLVAPVPPVPPNLMKLLPTANKNQLGAISDPLRLETPFNRTVLLARSITKVSN